MRKASVLTILDFLSRIENRISESIGMKQKVGTQLESDVLRRAKRRAADERRPLSDVIQDALERYLSGGVSEPARREAAFRLFCEQPVKLTRRQFKSVLEHDSWDL
jgi:hypothetical protein